VFVLLLVLRNIKKLETIKERGIIYQSQITFFLMDAPMKYTVCLLAFLSISTFTFAKDEEKIWKKCKADSDCKIALGLSCNGLCYNKNFKKEVFDWEKKIVWDCMPAVNKNNAAYCIKGLCSCEIKSF